jgi:hypothetical protein
MSDASKGQLLRVVAPYFCAAVIAGERAAPIIKYMASWNEKQIRAYCAKRRWECT